MSRRSEQLRTVAQEFCQMHDAWVNDEHRSIIDGIYSSAIDNLLKTFSDGDIPADCRELAEAVGEFSKQVQEFDDNGDQVPPEGSDFWKAREGIAEVLQDERQVNRRAALEPIARLREQGATN